MRRIRSYLIIVLSLVALVPAFSAGLRTAKTDHFEIIYEKGNETTASLIYDNCEAIYKDLVSYYGTDPDLKLPIVITRSYKVLNAYYTSFTANHIVLFDTVGEERMLYNSDNILLYVLEHELAHAFQYNIRSPFFNLMSKIFGDPVSIGPFLYMTPAFIEGGAVLYESRTGQGRLNDSYSMSIVRQAKVEGLFPTWIDISGARDTYPGGLLYYNFAAAFLSYLSETYGEEKVSSLYVSLGAPGWFETVSSIFKETFGTTIAKAWQEFYLWVDAPQVISEDNASDILDYYGLFSDLMVSDFGGIYFYDAATGKVKRLSKDLSTCKDLFVSPTVYPSLDVSDESLTLALVPDVDQYSASVKLMNRDGTLSGRLVHRFSDKNKNFRDGIFVSMGGAKLILLYSNIGQETFLDIYDMVEYSRLQTKSISLGYGANASDFCQINDDTVAFILSREGHDNVALLKLSDMSIVLVDNPIDVQITSLSKGKTEEGNILCFTWYPSSASSSSFGRYGEFDVQSMNVRLGSTDISGGMNEALRINDKILFVSSYYEGDKLRIIDESILEYELEGLLLTSSYVPSEGPQSLSIKENSKVYLPFKYIKDGILLPFASMSISDTLMDIGAGASWLSMDPTESYATTVSAGYGLLGPFASIGFASENIVPFSVSASYAYRKPNHILGLEATVQKSFDLQGLNQSIDIANTFNKTFMFLPGGSVKNLTSNNLQIQYSSSYSTGLGPYDYNSLSIGATLSNLDPGVTLAFHLSHILPFKNPHNWVFNLPLGVSLHASYNTSGSNIVASGAINAVLFDYEIQSGIQLLGLYFRRLALEVDYFASYDGKFENTLSLGLGLHLSPVIGSALTCMDFVLGAKLEIDFKNSPSVTVLFNPGL